MRDVSDNKGLIFARQFRTLVALLVGGALVAAPWSALADSLEDILTSRTLHDISKVTGKSARRPSKEPPKTNYEGIWVNPKAGQDLLQWLGARGSGLRVERLSFGQRKEYTHGSLVLTNRERVSVELTVQVPHPSYMTMAEYGTLADFNRFRPPMLDVIADQTIPIQGLEAQYFRARDGSCSLLFRLEKYSIVNLYTRKCSDAPIMMSVAKELNFARLNQKLTS